VSTDSTTQALKNTEVHNVLTLKICQLERMIRLIIITVLILSTCFTASCSKSDKKRTLEQKLNDFSASTFPNYKYEWFDVDGVYKVRDRSGDVQKHLFYDPKPEIDETDKSINFIVTTPVDSASYFDVDLVSGMTYRVHRFCKQTDVWQQYNEAIQYPPYTEGIVPRVLDKLGRPQKILVFGNDSYYAGRITHNTRRVKIIGGLVEQYCEMGHCTGARSWQTHLLLVALDTEDKKFANIETIKQLKKIVDWNYVRAFRQNGVGRNIVATSEYPAYRLGGFVRARAAVNYLQKQAKTFSTKNLMSMRKSCHALYDFIWENLGSLSEKKELKISKRAISKMRKKIKELKSEFKKDNKIYKKHKKYNFVQNFRAILDNFSTQYQTCSDYVKPSNVNEGFERHWFFAYFTSVMKLYQMGHYYNCDTHGWYYNPIDAQGKQSIDNVKILDQCNNRSLNKAFSYSISYMGGLKSSGSRYYRYVDYDNGDGATHNKIYSWVPVLFQNLKCDKSILDLYRKKVKKEDKFIFPTDIYWSNIE
jgi:hypothetical protein